MQKQPYIHLVSFSLKEHVQAKDFFKPLTILYELLQKQGICIWGLQTATHDGTEIPDNNFHYFRMVFASQKDFQSYLMHPEHKAFEKMALEKWVIPESIKIANTAAQFRQSTNNAERPANRPRSCSA